MVQQLTAESMKLAELQIELNERINALMQETYRRSYSRTPTKSKRVTPEIRVSVRKLAADFPDMSHQELADAHGINPGRISEILHGKR
jgi:hypothetical protein